MQDIGIKLSAFNLQKYVPDANANTTVECVYQSSKVFRCGGPYTDLLFATSREAKKDERLRTSGTLKCFRFNGVDYPLVPRSAFYNYIYINALAENEDLAAELIKYDAFTDIEFNAEKSENCQARAAAMFVSLARLNLLDQIKDFNSFISLYNEKPIASKPATVNKSSEQKAETKQPEIKVGMTVRHKKFGSGTVTGITPSAVTATFPDIGEKSLGLQWSLVNCDFSDT